MQLVTVGVCFLVFLATIPVHRGSGSAVLLVVFLAAFGFGGLNTIIRFVFQVGERGRGRWF
jgi:hypothetical protein